MWFLLVAIDSAILALSIAINKNQRKYLINQNMEKYIIFNHKSRTLCLSKGIVLSFQHLENK